MFRSLLTAADFGLANYLVGTIKEYSRRAAIVQSGLRTQALMGFITLSIVGSCITLLVVNRLNQTADE